VWVGATRPHFERARGPMVWQGIEGLGWPSRSPVIRSGRRRQEIARHLLRRDATPARPRDDPRGKTADDLLDEPTTGLDPRSRHTMWRIIRDLVAGGVTIFLTTQYL